METLLSLRREDLWSPDHGSITPPSLEEEKAVSPASSCESIKSDRSMTPPLLFKGNISYRHDNTKYRVEILPGSPSVYRLIPEQKNIGPIRRLTLGERDPTKINKTILLVGETGSGKSSLINALVNYAMGVEYEEDLWYQIVQEEKKSQTESQTSDVIVYEVFGLEDRTLPFSLTIIDTPGFGDTRGIERDVLVRKRLLDLFRSRDGVHEIDAVCLVLKASDNRLSDRQTYVFDSVVSLFGKEIEENIVALITHSDFFSSDHVLQALKDAKIMCAKDEEGQSVHFMFDNRQKTVKKKKNERALKNAWESTEDQISQFADFLKDTKPQDLKKTVEVLKSRIRLTACIHKLQERIEFIELKQREIKLTQEGLKKHEQDMKNNEDFTIEVDEVYKCKEPANERRWRPLWPLWFHNVGATCCEVCKETCHYPSTVGLGPSNCQVMQNKCTICNKDCSIFAGHWFKKELYCTACTGKCHVSKHVNDEQCTKCEDECSDPDHPKTGWRYVNKTRRVKKTIQQMKDMYEKSEKGSEESGSLLETLQKNIEDLQKDKDQFLEESFQHVVKLEEIALKVVSISTHVHLDFLIEKMNEKGDTEKVKKLEEMKSKMEENPRVKSALSYVSGIGKATREAAMDFFRGNTAEKKTSSTR